ncbi:hypothetical protein DPMN_036418 [Dreissena polymorpha]|uniref:Uncharacterized protein n=1 Tax=Dreissena polymorpha TaxID=45954 RepID=A0A9D4MBH2_DREPO|nr:hypothetical protein DPMN_036418 [Dreissena polymorpha]
MLGKSSKAGVINKAHNNFIESKEKWEVTALGPVYGYEKHLTGLERHMNRIGNTRFLPCKPSFC